MLVEPIKVGNVSGFQPGACISQRAHPVSRAAKDVCGSVTGTILGAEGSFPVDGPTGPPSEVIQPQKATNKQFRRRVRYNSKRICKFRCSFIYLMHQIKMFTRNLNSQYKFTGRLN